MSDSGRRDARSFNPAANQLQSPKCEPLPHGHNQQSCINQGLKTPTHKTYNWSTGWSNVDSPGSGEVSQDIIWDSTSPNPRNGARDNRVTISDIVNRIAPKNGKPVGPVSPWRQWMSDSAMTCTPENRQPRVRKTSIRQSNAEDLLKLARKFDDDLREHAETPLRTTSTKMAPQSEAGVQEPFCTMWEQAQAEIEFQALFDSSTQRISGGLSSQGSSVSSRSQEKGGCPEDQATSVTNGAPPQTKLMSAGSSSQQFKSPHAVGANPIEGESSSSYVGVAKCDDVDDDWDNDDLLLDSCDQAMNQHSEPPRYTVPSPTSSIRPATNQQSSDCQPQTNGSSACQVSHLPPQPNGRSLQEQCPKPKTSNRRSFKLESNPHFQPSSLASDLEKNTTWDNLDDDLLYEVCENAEKISSTQLEQTRSANCQGKQGNCQQNVTTPLAIKTARSLNGANDVRRQLSCTFVRSNSLPVATNYQGWNASFKGAKVPQSVMSQSHPGTLEGLGTFSHLKDSSGTFQANMAIQPRTVTARPTQNASHSSFKRTLSDSGVVSNKVLVTNQTTAKCSAAEIERKKQEALARRRQRMSQMSQKR